MPGKNKKFFAFTLYPGVTPLDLVGPLTVLRDLKMGLPYRTVVVGESITAMASDTPVQMMPAKRFRDFPNPFAVIVPGGVAATVDALHDASLLDYVRSAAETAEVIGATGNGALILAAAGLLQGRRAAAHWAYREVLEGLGATYTQERWVQDGKFFTSAGGSAGIDMMLHLVAKLRNQSRARLAQLAVEYDPQPPFGGIDWSNVDEDVAKVLRPAQGSAGSLPGRRR